MDCKQIQRNKKRRVSSADAGLFSYQIMTKKIQSILQTMMLIGKSMMRMAYRIIWE